MAPARTIVFRCDASVPAGAGHVYRCMALAAAFERRGWRIGFAVSPLTPAFVPALAGRGWRVAATIPEGTAGEGAVAGGWPEGVLLAVVDSYALAAPDEVRLRPWARHVLAIDDLADRPHDCDGLIDQTLGRDPDDYDGLVPPDALLLCGARYALLRSEFAGHRAEALARRGAAWSVQRVLVSLGATDEDELALRAVLAVRRAAPGSAIDAVVGRHSSSLAALEAEAQRDAGLTLHVDTAGMARLMADADLAVGAAGSSAWERCCLGLPTIMLVLADNQGKVASALEAAGAAAVVAPGAQMEERIADAVRELAGDPVGRTQMAQRAAEVTDGLGADRAAEAMEALIDRGAR